MNAEDERPIVLKGGTLVTCDRDHRIQKGDLLIQGDRIVRAGRGGRLPAGTQVVDVSGKYVIPGLIMTHVHLCQVLIRGSADDLPLLDWLKRRVWPMEAAHDDASLRASAELGLAEMLLAGTTTILDLGTVHGHDVVFDAARRSGVRYYGGKSLMDGGDGVPRALREPTAASLKDCERLADAWDGVDGRLHYVYIPRFILSCSEAQIRGAVEQAGARGALLHTHASEHPGERAAVVEALGETDVRRLRKWGLKGPRASIAHGVQLTAAEMKLLARDGTGVVHCPSANLKLGSGIARVRQLLDAGITVGLGADGAPCNNNLDPWMELRRAALLSSAVAGPGALPARDALHLLTLGGARLLGAEAELGSLEVGKRADVVVVDPDVPHVVPSPDPVAALVYSSQARDVRHVFVAGRAVVSHGEVTTLEVPRVVSAARRHAARLRRRAGL